MKIDVPAILFVTMLMQEYELEEAPAYREYNVEHIEVEIPIGPNNYAYLTMDKSAFRKLQELSGVEISEDAYEG